VINNHLDEHHEKPSVSFKELSQGESDEEAADDVVHSKQSIDQGEPKEPSEDLSDQTHDLPGLSDDKDTVPLIGDVTVESDHDTKSGTKFDKDNTLDISIHQPDGVDDEDNASKVSNVSEPEAAVDPTSQLKGEDHDEQVTIVDDINNQPNVNIDPETLPSEERITSQEKPDNHSVDVDLSSDTENLSPLSFKQTPDPNVALDKAKLHKYLESKDLLFQLTDQSGEEKDPQSLDSILSEYTGLDVLDEDNKFICKTCSENCKFFATYIMLNMINLKVSYNCSTTYIHCVFVSTNDTCIYCVKFFYS